MKTKNKVDLQKLGQLNTYFTQLIHYIFLSSDSNETFNSLTGAQKKILALLKYEGPQKMSDIARRVPLTLGGATGIVERMVHAKLVERENDPADRRVIRISLSATGMEAVRDLNRMHEERFRQVLEELDPGKQEELISSFERIHAIMSELDIPTLCKAIDREQ